MVDSNRLSSRNRQTGVVASLLTAFLMSLVVACANGKDTPSSGAHGDEPDKRNPQFYSFGLGKKSSIGDLGDYELASFPDGMDLQDLNKRENNLDRYSFGLGKRINEPSRFGFGLGKKADTRFAFGLGKRDPSRFAFGLGKREIGNDELEEYIKRRFSFGLGKRSPDNRYAFGLGKRNNAQENYRI